MEQGDYDFEMKDFQILKKVGKGSFGNVYQAKYTKTGEILAIKEVKVDSGDRKNMESIASEIRILCSIEHKNIVSYKGSFWHPKHNQIYIVMEFLGGGDLQQKIQKCKRDRTYIPETKIWSYLIQMVTGLKVLHDLKIIHRDIKSANTFMTQDFESVKLGDMNVSKVTKRNFAQTQVGTPLYISPEIWQAKKYDYKTDIWSLGCLLYEMCTLNYPFLGMDMNSLKRSILRGRYAPIPKYYDNDLSIILKKCLQVDPYRRPTAAGLLEDPIVRKRVKQQHEMTVMNLGNIDLKLIDTIKVPWDFKKIKLPNKARKMGIKRSNSVSGIRRPSSSKADIYGSKRNVRNSSRNKDTVERSGGGGSSSRYSSNKGKDRSSVRSSKEDVIFSKDYSSNNPKKYNRPPSNLPSGIAKRKLPPVNPRNRRGLNTPTNPYSGRNANNSSQQKSSRENRSSSRRNSKVRLPSAEDKRSRLRSRERLNSRERSSSRKSSSKKSNAGLSKLPKNYVDPYKDYSRRNYRNEIGRRQNSRGQRAPSAGGRMRVPSYNSRPRWWQ